MITGNEPAMPIQKMGIAEDNNGKKWCGTGLSIRQYFAAIAMQGLIASTDWNESAATEGFTQHGAELSVKYADALIKELNNIPKS